MLGLCADEDLRSLLTKPFICAYKPTEFPSSCEKISRESERYAPFVCTFTKHFEPSETFRSNSQTRPVSKLSIMFCRNAEKDIQGSHLGADDGMLTRKRKPDIILTSTSAIRRIMAFDGPIPDQLYERISQQPPSNFTWHDVLSPWEFELYRETLPVLPTCYGTSL